MTDNREAAQSGNFVRFVGSRGSQVTGRHKEKRERIREALCDLQLAVDGTASQLARSERSEQFLQTAGALARACSIFLRKTVIGDRNDRKTRLLDDEICRSLDLKFGKIRSIPGSRREFTIRQGIDGGHLRIEKLDEVTRETQSVQEMAVSALRLEVSVEWPLPGAAGWIEDPTRGQPWEVSPEQLFEPDSNIRNCDEWLSQVLVMFDDRGISLKDAIRTTATYEGAHSLNVSRLMRTETEKDTNPSRNPELHILNNVKICGIKFNHIVVIESALHLYKTLVGNTGLEKPEGEVVLPTLCLVSESTESIFSAARNFLHFDGGVILSFGGEPKSISHKIRAVR